MATLLAQMCLQNDPKCYQEISTKFKKNFLMPHSLMHCLMCLLENWPQLQCYFVDGNVLNFVVKKLS